ncbi:MAG: hypothetical protein L0H36_03115 [bacterium]|nr:hypothetical protein [bacterium]MDN5835601.1 hypothetical protein [bacterium]
MKKYILISSLILAVVLISLKSGVASSLLLFVLVGAVPGTSLTLSPVIMFLVIACAVVVGGAKLLKYSDSQSN